MDAERYLLSTFYDILPPYKLVIALALRALRIMMRERIAIEQLLTLKSMYLYIHYAETTEYGVDSPAVHDLWNEAVKCAINSVYDRPEFVKELTAAKGLERLAALLKVWHNAAVN